MTPLLASESHVSVAPVTVTPLDTTTSVYVSPSMGNCVVDWL